ncbi:MAG TPA: copper-binding protein [Chloroflexota bacterium]|nr:copper-binding protein [Chloroflexota bacterium]
MNIRTIFLLASATLAVAACGKNETSVEERATQEPAASETATAQGQSYTGKGDVTEVSGDQVTISHGPIEGIGWPAMTMPFRAGSSDMLKDVNPGDPVSFSFQQSGNEYVLTSLEKSS